jgi:hypothetical protein
VQSQGNGIISFNRQFDGGEDDDDGNGFTGNQTNLQGGGLGDNTINIQNRQGGGGGNSFQSTTSYGDVRIYTKEDNTMRVIARPGNDNIATTHLLMMRLQED